MLPKRLHPGPLFRLHAMPARLDLLCHVSRQAFQALNFSLNGHDSCSEIYICLGLEVTEQFGAALIGITLLSPSPTQKKKKLFSLRPSTKISKITVELCNLYTGITENSSVQPSSFSVQS